MINWVDVKEFSLVQFIDIKIYVYINRIDEMFVLRLLFVFVVCVCDNLML